MGFFRLKGAVFNIKWKRIFFSCTQMSYFILKKFYSNWVIHILSWLWSPKSASNPLFRPFPFHKSKPLKKYERINPEVIVISDIFGFFMYALEYLDGYKIKNKFYILLEGHWFLKLLNQKQLLQSNLLSLIPTWLLLNLLTQYYWAFRMP